MKAETLDAGIDRIMAAFGDRVIVPVTIPAAPLIGRACRHIEPFGPHGYVSRQCPVCGEKLTPSDVIVDSLALAIRRLVVAHPGYRRHTAPPEMAAELAEFRRPAGGGPANGVVVMYTEEGWSVPGGTDVFRYTDLATDDEALEWLNTSNSDEVAELPGVGPVTAMVMAAYMPVEGPLASVAARFIGPRRKNARPALTAAVRAFKIRQSAPLRLPPGPGPAGVSGGSGTAGVWPSVDPRLPQPPAERAETALVSAVYHRAAAAYSPGGAAVVAAIAARLHREASPAKAAMWIAAVHTDDVAAALAVYRQVWPGSAPSVAHFLEVIEPHLRTRGDEACNTLAVVGYDPIATPPNQAIRRHNRQGTARAEAEKAAAARMARKAAVDAVRRIYGEAAPAQKPCAATATTPMSGASPAPPSSSPTPPTAPQRPSPPPSALGPVARTSPPAPSSTPSPPSATAPSSPATTPPASLATPPPPSSSTAPGSC
jgi:hypothetical protein